MITYRHDRARQTVSPEKILLHPKAKLHEQILAICRLTETTTSRFGRDAVGDPRLYSDMVLEGRQPRGDTLVRILMHLNQLALDHSRKIDAIAGMAALDRANARKAVIHA